MLAPDSVNLTHIARCNERFDVVLAYVFHKGGELFVGQQALDFHCFLARVASRYFVQAAAAHDGMDNVVAYIFIVLGDDAYPFALVQAHCEIIHHQAVDPGADEAYYHKAERIDKECGAADDDACDGDAHSYVEVQVFVDYLCEYVKPAGGGVDAEEQGLGGAQYQHESQEVKPMVAHNGSGALLEQALVGAYFFPDVDHGAEDQGGVGCLHSEFGAYEEVGEHEEYGIDYQHYGGYFHDYAHIGKDAAQHY